MKTHYVGANNGAHRFECDAELQVVAENLREDIRLILQYHLDHQPYIDADGTHGHGGGVTGYDAAQEEATRNGWLSRYRPEDANGRACSGTILTVLNHTGAIVLREANAARGDKATRLVWGIKYFGHGVKPLHLCGPYIVPLSDPVIRDGHGLYIEVDAVRGDVRDIQPVRRKSFFERVLG